MSPSGPRTGTTARTRGSSTATGTTCGRTTTTTWASGPRTMALFVLTSQRANTGDIGIEIPAFWRNLPAENSSNRDLRIYECLRSHPTLLEEN